MIFGGGREREAAARRWSPCPRNPRETPEKRDARIRVDERERRLKGEFTAEDRTMQINQEGNCARRRVHNRAARAPQYIDRVCVCVCERGADFIICREERERAEPLISFEEVGDAAHVRGQLRRLTRKLHGFFRYRPRLRDDFSGVRTHERSVIILDAVESYRLVKYSNARFNDLILEKRFRTMYKIILSIYGF